MATTRRPGPRWPRTVDDARAVQESLRARVRLGPRRGPMRLIAGADVSSQRGSDRVWAAVVLLSWPDLEPAGIATAVRAATFPYVPGYLSFREGPVLDEAFARLPARPDCVILDGQGLAHPRRFGLACHLGVLWDVPTIGCAKSRLVGEAVEPGPRKGDRAPLLDRGESIGYVLRTRDRVNPVWVSPGHRIAADQACEIVLAATTRFRLPEPTRRAHGEVNAFRRADRAGGASSTR